MKYFCVYDIEKCLRITVIVKFLYFFREIRSPISTLEGKGLLTIILYLMVCPVTGHRKFIYI